MKNVNKMVWKAKFAEEHRVALTCHENSKELFDNVNKHNPRALLGPLFSSDRYFVTDVEEMDR